jgi:hypothetical protein
MSEMNFEYLQNTTEERLNQLIGEVDRLYYLVNKINKNSDFFKEISSDSDIIGFKNLIDFRLFIGIVTMDLCSAILISTKSKSSYENIYSARQVIVIINEAYKKIYNFVSENEYGDIIKKNRNNSYWIKEIGYIIKNALPELEISYNELTKELDDYLDVNFRILKYQRDMSIHYDKDPSKVYEMLIELDVDETFRKLIPFIGILNKMFAFTDKVKDAFKYKIELKTKNIEENYDEMIQKLEQLKNNDNKKQIEEFQNMIIKIKLG